MLWKYWKNQLPNFHRDLFLEQKISHCNNTNGSLLLILENAWIMSEAV